MRGLEALLRRLEAGEVLHMSDVVAPGGVEILADPETVVASITAASRVEVEGEDEVEAAPEPEIVGGRPDDESE